MVASIFAAQQPAFRGGATVSVVTSQAATTYPTLPFTPTWKLWVHEEYASATFLGNNANITATTGTDSGRPALTIVSLDADPVNNPIRTGSAVRWKNLTRAPDNFQLLEYKAGSGSGENTVGAIYYLGREFPSETLPAVDFVLEIELICNNLVTGMDDFSGTMPISATVGAAPNVWVPPTLMTDGHGNKFLRCQMTSTSIGSVVEQGTAFQVAGLTGIDTHNMQIVIVGRPLQPNIGNCMVSVGVYGGAGNSAPYTGGAWMHCRYGNQRSRGQMFLDGLGQTLSTINRTTESAWIGTNLRHQSMGCNLQVMAFGTSTSGGYGGTGGSCNRRGMVNGNMLVQPAATSTRATSKQGLTFGRNCNGNGLSAEFMVMDIYGIFVYSLDELANGTTTTARAGAVDTNLASVVTAIRTHQQNIPATYTKQLAVEGDSRNDVDGSSGFNQPALLTDPGSAYAMPYDCKVLPLCLGGTETQATRLHAWLHNGPLRDFMLLDGGRANNLCIELKGTNDTGQNSMNYARLTDNRGEEIYDGFTSIDSGLYNFTGSCAAFTLTVTTGGAAQLMPVNTSGGGMLKWTGQTDFQRTYVSAGSGPTYTLGISNGTIAEQAMTFDYGNMMKTAQEVIAEGWNFVQHIEPMASNGTYTSSQTIINNHITNDMMTDMDANPGGTREGQFFVHDTKSILVGGVSIFGAGATNNGGYYQDSLHPTPNGRRRRNDGGDTPQHGLAYIARQRLGYPV